MRGTSPSRTASVLGGGPPEGPPSSPIGCGGGLRRVSAPAFGLGPGSGLAPAPAWRVPASWAPAGPSPGPWRPVARSLPPREPRGLLRCGRPRRPLRGPVQRAGPPPGFGCPFGAPLASSLARCLGLSPPGLPRRSGPPSPPLPGAAAPGLPRSPPSAAPAGRLRLVRGRGGAGLGLRSGRAPFGPPPPAPASPFPSPLVEGFALPGGAGPPLPARRLRAAARPSGGPLSSRRGAFGGPCGGRFFRPGPPGVGPGALLLFRGRASGPSGTGAAVAQALRAFTPTDASPAPDGPSPHAPGTGPPTPG